MVHSKERYKELVATNDQGLLFLILEAMEKQNELLAKLVSGEKLTPEAAEEAVIGKRTLGRPRKTDQEAK